MDYEKDMHIDEEALDVELLNQPERVYKYSKLLAEAKQELELAKENLSLVKAEIDLDIRDNPDKYKLQKVTETAITNIILLEEEYKEAQARLNKAMYEVNVLQGAVYAINDRKSSLENLVKLHGQDYFAGPSIPHNLSELRKEKQEELHHNIGKSMKRKSSKK